MSKKTKLLYVVDVVIAIAFILSASSGLVLALAGPGGYRGGRNPSFGQLILGLGRGIWEDAHLWASLALIGGVLIHLVLHWNWIVCTTKRLLRPRSATVQPPYPMQSEA